MHEGVILAAVVIVLVGLAAFVFDRKAKNLAMRDAIEKDDLASFLRVRSTRKRLQTEAVDRTWLYISIFKNAPTIFEHLMDSGISPSLPCTRENPDPLLCACVLQGRLDMLKRLVAAGYPTDVPGSDGNTALHVMAKFGACEKAEILINGGADCNVKNAEGQTPLGIATKNGKTKVLELLQQTQ